MSKAGVTKISCSERKWLEIHTKEFIFQKKRMSTGNSNFHMNAEVVLLLMILFIIQNTTITENRKYIAFVDVMSLDDMYYKSN